MTAEQFFIDKWRNSCVYAILCPQETDNVVLTTIQDNSVCSVPVPPSPALAVSPFRPVSQALRLEHRQKQFVRCNIVKDLWCMSKFRQYCHKNYCNSGEITSYDVTDPSIPLFHLTPSTLPVALKRDVKLQLTN